MKSIKPHYAEIGFTTIHTLLENPIVYPDFAAAMKVLDRLRRRYILSKDLLPDPERTLRLWIEGYDLSPADIAIGLVGNYADVAINEQADGHYTITFKKFERDGHPRRVLPPRDHPNWGQPLLRAIKNKKAKYKFVTDAQGALKRYFEEYPAITYVRDKNSLFTIVWDGIYNPRPTKKFLLEVVEAGEDGFVIEANESVFDGEGRSPRPKVDESPSYPQQIYIAYLG